MKTQNERVFNHNTVGLGAEFPVVTCAICNGVIRIAEDGGAFDVAAPGETADGNVGSVAGVGVVVVGTTGTIC